MGWHLQSHVAVSGSSNNEGQGGEYRGWGERRRGDKQGMPCLSPSCPATAACSRSDSCQRGWSWAAAAACGRDGADHIAVQSSVQLTRAKLYRFYTAATETRAQHRHCDQPQHSETSTGAARLSRSRCGEEARAIRCQQHVGAQRRRTGQQGSLTTCR